MLQHPAVLLWGDCSHVKNLTPTLIRVLAGNGWHLPKGLIEGTVTEVQVGLTGPVVHGGAPGDWWQLGDTHYSWVRVVGMKFE